MLEVVATQIGSTSLRVRISIMEWCDEGDETVPIFLLSEREATAISQRKDVDHDDPEVVEEVINILNSVHMDEGAPFSQDLVRSADDYLRQSDRSDGG